MRLAGYAAAGLLLAFYFAQHSRMPPNSVDGALILDYLEEMCAGRLPFWEFIDVYGPLNWVFPLLFYVAAGQEIWGVRLWMVIVKLLSVATVYLLVRRFSGRFYATLAVAVTAVLLGLPWTFLQTAYAAHNAFPVMLLAWYAMLREPLSGRRKSIALTGLLTAIVLWTKINTGLFLLAGGLFYYFYWQVAPRRGDAGGDDRGGRAGRWVRIAQAAGLPMFGTVFYLYFRNSLDLLYFLYLGAPLLLILVWTAAEMRRRALGGVPLKHHPGAASLYALATSAFWAVFFFGYYGWKGGGQYLLEMAALLGAADYVNPIPTPGKPGFLEGFHEWYWLQLPWLLTLVFCARLGVGVRQRVNRAAGNDGVAGRARESGLFVLAALNGFVLYPRSDEAHIFQALVPCVPVLFVLLCSIERNVFPRREIVARSTLAVAVILACSTIFTVPTFSVFAPAERGWYGHRFRFIQRGRRVIPDMGKHEAAGITEYDWNVAIDQTGLCVDALTRNGDEVLVLTSNQLINYHSHTTPFGGRYRYHFYLLKNDLLDRTAFERLVPGRTVWRMLNEPPRVIVSAMGEPPLLARYPELNLMLKRHYRVVQKYAHILIYLRAGERLYAGLCDEDLLGK
jgi:hypothetical protein